MKFFNVYINMYMFKLNKMPCARLSGWAMYSPYKLSPRLSGFLSVI